jgi:hypothetical protein
MVFGSDIDGRQMRGKGELLLLLYALTCQSFFFVRKNTRRDTRSYAVRSCLANPRPFDF